MTWPYFRHWLARKLWRWAVDINGGYGPWTWAPVRPNRLCPRGYHFVKFVREDGHQEWHWSSPCRLRGSGSGDITEAIEGAWKDWATHG